jgi:translocator protein
MPTQTESIQAPRPHAAPVLIGWLILCFAVEGVAVVFSVHSIPTPYDWLLPLAWTAIYGLMAIGAWLVWKTRPSTCRRTGLRLFLVQLWFSVLWAWIFFDRNQLGVAFVDTLVLWISIALTMTSFRKVSTAAAWLLVPHLAWATFAGYLTLVLWRRW